MTEILRVPSMRDLGMDRPLRQAEGARRFLRRAGARRLAHRRRESRRRDVDRLLEKGPVERVGLVEEGEHPERSSRSGGLPARPRRRGRSPRRGSPRRRRLRARRPTAPPRMRTILSQASTNCGGPSARITPRLAARKVGLSTHGYATSPEAARGSPLVEKSRCGGEATPASRQALPHDGLVAGGGHRRDRVVRQAAGARQWRRPRPPSARPRPRRRPRESSPRTSATRSAHAARSAKSSVSRPAGFSRSIVLASSEATVTSRPSSAAAARKSGVR